MSDAATAAKATSLPEDVPTAALRRAILAGDVDGVLALCSDRATMHSPVSERAGFRGGAVRLTVSALLATLQDVELVADIGEGTTRALFATANVDGHPTEKALPVDVAIRVELDDQQKVQDLTVFIRPLPGLAGFALGAGPHIARRYGRIPAWLTRMQILPIALGTQLFDRVVGMLDKKARSQRSRRAS